MIHHICHFLRRVTIGAVCCLIPAGPASAAEVNNQTPEQAVKTFLETVGSMEFPAPKSGGEARPLILARRPASDSVLHDELVRQANAYLDVETMGSRALADHWDGVPSEERKAFFDLLWKLVETVAYPKNQNLMGKEQIVYGEPVRAGEGFQVPVTLKTKDEEAPAASMSYHLSEKEGRWKIDDVVLDDVSIIEDLKYQFNKIITEAEFSGLLAKMRKRLTEAEGKQK